MTEDPAWPRPGTYRHWKGALYRVHGIARHSETGEMHVVYEPLYAHDGPHYSVRPLDNWNERIDRDGYQGPRFYPSAITGAEIAEWERERYACFGRAAGAAAEERLAALLVIARDRLRERLIGFCDDHCGTFWDRRMEEIPDRDPDGVCAEGDDECRAEMEAFRSLGRLGGGWWFLENGAFLFRETAAEPDPMTPERP